MRKPNYRFERAERDRAKKARNDKKMQRQQERAATVRRQGFRDNRLGKLREALAHRCGAVRPPAGGAASDGWQWCVV